MGESEHIMEGSFEKGWLGSIALPQNSQRCRGTPIVEAQEFGSRSKIDGPGVVQAKSNTEVFDVRCDVLASRNKRLKLSCMRLIRARVRLARTLRIIASRASAPSPAASKLVSRCMTPADDCNLRVLPPGSFGFNRSDDRFAITLGMAGLPLHILFQTPPVRNLTIHLRGSQHYVAGVTGGRRGRSEGRYSCTEHVPVKVIDTGTYLVTDTIFVPPGTILVGQMFSFIMGSGPKFADQNNPRPVLKANACLGLRPQADIIILLALDHITPFCVFCLDYGLAPCQILSGPFQTSSLSFSILYAIHQPTPAVSHTPTQRFFRPAQYWSLRRICCLKGRGNPLGVGTHPLNSHFAFIDSSGIFRFIHDGSRRQLELSSTAGVFSIGYLLLDSPCGGRWRWWFRFGGGHQLFLDRDEGVAMFVGGNMH
ncbi:hypothetical protein C8J57DRAFT_1253623 [Mycena rebaudengoi]|nr:hypothetical protein C8J57DRAFT_1253623 [Mycena rebaudengoi]